MVVAASKLFVLLLTGVLLMLDVALSQQNAIISGGEYEPMERRCSCSDRLYGTEPSKITSRFIWPEYISWINWNTPAFRVGNSFYDPCISHTAHWCHTPQYTIKNIIFMHIYVLNGVLWDTRRVHRGICETWICESTITFSFWMYAEFL